MLTAGMHVTSAGAAAGAGAASALVGCPAELLMIQQQKSGQPLLAEARRMVSDYGALGLYRGLVRHLASPLRQRGLS